MSNATRFYKTMEAAAGVNGMAYVKMGYKEFPKSTNFRLMLPAQLFVKVKLVD